MNFGRILYMFEFDNFCTNIEKSDIDTLLTRILALGLYTINLNIEMN